MKPLIVLIFLIFYSFGNGYSQTGSELSTDSEIASLKTIAVENLPFINNPDITTEFFAVVFLGTDCPISQKYVHTLRTLHKNYRAPVTFFGIIPHNFSEEKITTFNEEYSIPFRLLKDHDNSYARLFNASVTPEVFLFDATGKIFYDGAIDNWFFALGRNRLKATEHYLDEAIKNVTSGKTVSIPHKDAVGCFIEFRKK